jgi:uncharacterized protein YukE
MQLKQSPHLLSKRRLRARHHANMIRVRIEEEVGDVYDLVADLSKRITLLESLYAHHANNTYSSEVALLGEEARHLYATLLKRHEQIAHIVAQEREDQKG